MIYNPVAGRQPAIRERQMQQAAAILENRGIHVRLAPTSGPGAARRLARDAVSTSELVIACGGDGTINEVINGIVPSQTPLAILTGGTANIAAKDLRLPHDPIRAARALPRWRPRCIALGRVTWPAAVDSEMPGSALSPGTRVEQRYFLSVAGIGFDAYVVYRLQVGFKLSLGAAAYAIEAIRQSLRHSFPPVVCRVNERALVGTLAVIQRTERYAGWLHLTPSASFFEPRFYLCLFTSRSRWRYYVYAAAVFLRSHLHLKDIIVVSGEKIDCASQSAGATIHFQVDGELGGKLPATFEIVPDALTVLVP